jgi:hypothetical protein
MKVSFILFLACTQVINGLKAKKEESKYAYVTMWVSKAETPERVFKNILTKDQTVALNSAPVDIFNQPILNKGMHITSALQVADKKPDHQLKAKIPLRPRNSQWKGITDIAKNLRDVGSEIPLVVLTNEPIFKNETLQAQHPNLKFIWLKDTDFLDRKCSIGKGHELHFQKLAIWGLTQFDKVIWIDTDVAFNKNVDWIFTSKKFDLKNGDRIYGQHDDYQCDGREWSPTSGGICSAMLLIKPSKTHYQGLMQQQASMNQCWGDQSIIGSYFAAGSKAKRESAAFSRDLINFARCGKKNGWMDVVHFSGSPHAKRGSDDAPADTTQVA